MNNGEMQKEEEEEESITLVLISIIGFLQVTITLLIRTARWYKRLTPQPRYTKTHKITSTDLQKAHLYLPLALPTSLQCRSRNREHE